MRKILTLLTLGMCAVPLLAQVSQPGVPGQQISNPNALEQFSDRQGLTPKTLTDIPPQTPVVTLDGVCAAPRVPTKKTAPCKTTFTREQMEALMSVLAPGNPDARAQFTVTYARMLAAATSAEQQHLDKDPFVAKELEARIKFVRMQVLTEALYRQFEANADKVDLAEMKKYYDEHLSNFDEGELQRIVFPQGARTISGTSLDPAVVKAKAEELRQRAVAGEDFDLLQQVAYKDLAISSPVLPVTKLDKARRANLAFDQGKVFDLQPGGVSEVMESVEGLVILKLVSKRSASFESVQPDIHTALREQHLRQELQSASQQVKGDFNLAYLGTTSEPNLFPAPTIAKVSPRGAQDPRARTAAAARRRKPQLPMMPSSAAPPGR